MVNPKIRPAISSELVALGDIAIGFFASLYWLNIFLGITTLSRIKNQINTYRTLVLGNLPLGNLPLGFG